MLLLVDSPEAPQAEIANHQREASIDSSGSLRRHEAELDWCFSVDVVNSMIEEYARHVESLLDSRSTPARIEYAYSRLLGSRGSICRMCPAHQTVLLPRRLACRWRWAETALRDCLAGSGTFSTLPEIAKRVELGWADSIERYVTTLAARIGEIDIADKMGILKGIDTVGLHLAQREMFELSHTFSLPLENAHAIKLRVRLLSLFLTLHSRHFTQAYPAIQGYRRTFRITNPVTYPWWFVDCRLTERQLNWTYRRMPAADFTWRF